MDAVTNNLTTLKNSVDESAVNWVSQNTAVLVVHGIGNQLPLETLDSFGRGLIKQYKMADYELSVTHELVTKPAGEGKDAWFDNTLRLKIAGSPYYIDLYEYYWANYTEDKADSDDIAKWLNGVVKGASSFYSEQKNAELGKRYKDESPFFSKKGTLNRRRYKLFLFSTRHFFTFIRTLYKGLLRLIGLIPVVGNWAKSVIEDIEKSEEANFNNIIGDIVVYNVTDPKCKYYSVRRDILDSGVKALKYLIETGEQSGLPLYPSVIVAGHSLGTQVSYDVINKINLMINKGQISNYSNDGCHKISKKPISSQLNGFITFGSPLDKIAFFLREVVPDENYLRQQMLDDYHGFKQQDWSLNNKNINYTKVRNTLARFLDGILWRNYFDGHDPVSGALDYYKNLTNIDCRFKAKAGRLSFTHSDYWNCDDFYRDIISHFFR
ncbi:MAG TPA: hypothetical protein VG738_20665 [Chitinophagaceae bacterium]|nr:hypothetical protein [Chitinophagaceae bacterium]